MTDLLTVHSPPSMYEYLSDESAQLADQVRRLSQVGLDRGHPTSLMEAQAALFSGTVAQHFQSLVECWRRECAHLSSVKEMVLHPAYQQIIGMARDAVPFLLHELEHRPDHWFWALRAITREDPVRPEHRGDVKRMAQNWLDWARARGLVW